MFETSFLDIEELRAFADRSFIEREGEPYVRSRDEKFVSSKLDHGRAADGQLLVRRSRCAGPLALPELPESVHCTDLPPAQHRGLVRGVLGLCETRGRMLERKLRPVARD